MLLNAAERGQAIEIFTRLPSAQAQSDVLNRIMGKSQEQPQELSLSGTLNIVDILRQRHARRRQSQPYGQARKRFPDDAHLGDLLADALIRQREFVDAFRTFRESIGRFGLSYMRLNNVGVALLNIGRRIEAEEVWRSALSQKDAEHHAYFNLALAFVSCSTRTSLSRCPRVARSPNRSPRLGSQTVDSRKIPRH
jgi:tetratricopeptide (TPR) repeat protein